MKRNVTEEKIRCTMTRFKKPSREAQKQTHDQNTKEKVFNRIPKELIRKTGPEHMASGIQGPGHMARDCADTPENSEYEQPRQQSKGPSIEMHFRLSIILVGEDDVDSVKEARDWSHSSLLLCYVLSWLHYVIIIVICLSCMHSMLPCRPVSEVCCFVIYLFGFALCHYYNSHIIVLSAFDAALYTCARTLLLVIYSFGVVLCHKVI